MRNIKMLTVATALLLLAVACADDTTTDTTQPVLESVTAPSTTTVTADTAEDDAVTDETINIDTDETAEETTEAKDDKTEGAEEATETTDETTEDPGEAAEATDGTTDTGTTEEGVATEPVEDETDGDSQEIEPDDKPEPVEEPEEILIERVVVWEGVDSEEKCLVAGGNWADTHCEYWVFADPADALVDTYWHPSLMDDAYRAVAPETVEADHWETFEIGGPWGFYNYVSFFHFDAAGDDGETQLRVLRQVSQYAVRWAFMYSTDWVWFPYRYDVSWDDQPDTVVVVGTYPLGEKRTLRIHVDPEQRQTLDLDQPLPLPPPIRPTTPFAEPRWWDSAVGLGRDCPPVEEIWDGYGTEVTDPCTLQAIETAVDWAWRGDADWRQSAIRDGHALIDFLQELEHFEDPYEDAVLGHDSRIDGAVSLRDIKWAGQWPGASMISLEWDVAYSYREFTPEENTARKRYYDALLDRGIEVHEEYLRDDLTLDEEDWGWVGALIVRTHDGTWRMSQRSFCSWYERVIRVDREDLLCHPEDPTPQFPDSAFFDTDLYPPSHKNYYDDPRTSWPLQSLPHHDRGQPRRTGLYEGVPPS
ncbi:MAG: hypothetical protein OXQ32_04395 [bacterium]|nr:hypothetical protein [bacterium]